jgi:hypothetical protein
MVPVELSACDEHENFKIGAEQENYWRLDAVPSQLVCMRSISEAETETYCASLHWLDGAPEKQNQFQPKQLTDIDTTSVPNSC